jgi:hypothetical protein
MEESISSGEEIISLNEELISFSKVSGSYAEKMFPGIA